MLLLLSLLWRKGARRRSTSDAYFLLGRGIVPIKKERCCLVCVAASVRKTGLWQGVLVLSTVDCVSNTLVNAVKPVVVGGRLSENRFDFVHLSFLTQSGS